MKKLLIILGLVLVGAGVWGMIFTYQNVVAQKIVTPDDASIPGVPVRGPLTLKVQADIIQTHMLKMTGGKTYAEMPRQIPKLDASGKEVVGGDGKLVMVANATRDTWITAITLITALNLGLIAYAFSALALVNGLVFVLLGLKR